MPVYVYTCQTCELELEEMHPVGQAPEKSIRCPLCGGTFERVVTHFQFRREAHNQAVQNATIRPTHGPNCICCFPERRRR